MNMGPGNRGSISFFSTYRPPVPLDIFSCAVPPTSEKGEVPLTDGGSYNYNGRVVPPAALKTILKLPKLADYEGKEADVDSGRLSGMAFISERRRGLEMLHVALRFNGKNAVFSFDDLFPETFKDVRMGGVRMEDSSCFAGGDYILYVSTKQPASERRQPWTAVFSTNLRTRITERLTPTRYADLSPSLSPSGKKIAVASFQGKDGGWVGENEDLKTNIYVMNIVRKGLDRKMVVENGGWPTWGSDNVLFFHRKVGKYWGVFRLDDVSNASPDRDTSTRVTPEGISAMTPAAIDVTRVAVATIRQESGFGDKKPRVEAQYRHIEIFDSTRPEVSIKITQKDRPLVDHYNPFVIDGKKLSIGYHRANSDVLKGSNKDVPRQFHKIESPHRDVGLSRVTGVFPTFNSDGSMVAFVDNEFKNLWVANSEGSHIVCARSRDKLFSPVWDKKKDTLFVCLGPSFQSNKTLEIRVIHNVSASLSNPEEPRRLIYNGFNNAFPSTNPEGTKLVFRSTKDAGGKENYKNLYIAEDLTVPNGKITRLTEGHWTDTHCQWSPGGDWIVFSSNRDKPNTEEDKKKRASRKPQDDGEGYFAVYLVKWNDPSVVVRVITSANDIAGHVNHPFFSPDEKSIVVASDLAAVSADPISLPLFVHSVRPYGDIFTVDVDLGEISRLVDQKSAAGKVTSPTSPTPPPTNAYMIKKDVKRFERLTHSRFENSTATWSTMPSTEDPNKAITMKLSNNSRSFVPACPYLHPGGGESSHMTGHLFLPSRCC